MAFTVKDRYVFSGLSFECFQRTAVPPALNVHEVGVQTDEPALPQFAPPSDESSLPPRRGTPRPEYSYAAESPAPSMVCT